MRENTKIPALRGIYRVAYTKSVKAEALADIIEGEFRINYRHEDDNEDLEEEMEKNELLNQRRQQQ